MALNIIALCVFIFGAYAYGSVVVLTLRHGRPVWSARTGPGALRLNVPLQALVMYLVCTIWFVLHTIIAFRLLMGEPWNDDLIDLAALELVFMFPGLIFHTVLLESGAKDRHSVPTSRGWFAVLILLYVIGAAFAVYFPAAIFGLAPAPQPLGPYVGMSVGGLFSISSICCLAVMITRRRPSATRDERRLRGSLMFLFVAMIGIFLLLSFAREQAFLVQALEMGVRATPLLFLVVSVYFGNRLEFYDLIIKRGVIMLLSLIVLASVLVVSLGRIEQLPQGLSRPWLFAVALLPVAMFLPWMHDRVGRLLDRLWFGREFTPVEAVKRVLGGMQQATDEPMLVAATESTLSEMFRRRVVILLDDQAPPDRAITTDIGGNTSAQSLRVAIVDEAGARPMLSEDLALMRSLGSVFAFMLDNVRLQRKRQEQEQVAQELRLQSSRSELKALRAQINPHFLFNALNAIASLIHTDPTRADAAVEQLAEVFRYTLRRSEQEWAPLDQELAFAQAYLDVEEARFGRRLEFSIDAEPKLGRAQVPSMLLQTLVENAVKHGISRLRGPGRIAVSASQADGRLTLEVRDTGPGVDSRAHLASPAGESFGLRSVRDRLHGHFGTQATLELVRERDQTVARIRMPLIEHRAPAGASR
jgi:two-component sensor histidine kinase